MKLSDLLRTLRALTARPGRTALTLLGIVIGAGAIVLVAGLVSGGKAALVRTSQDATGSDLVSIRTRELPLAERTRGRPKLSRADSAALSRSWAARGRASHAESSRQSRARLEGRQKKVRLVSGNSETLSLYRLEVHSGRFLSGSDLKQRRRVCVVGHEVWAKLLRHRSVASQPNLVIEGQLWQVVGVLAEKPIMGSTTGTNIWDRKVIVPETTFDLAYSPGHEVDRVTVAGAANTSGSLAVLTNAIQKLLLRRHHGAKNFKVEDQAGGQMEQLILGIVEFLLIATGGLALLVGGINVMNVMLVSVSERTREIGIRRALGATRRTIAIQFLLESSLLSVLGGAVGVAIGGGLVHAGRAAFTSWLGYFPARVEPWSVALGMGLSLSIGIIFGLLPALRAARLHPVAALRNE